MYRPAVESLRAGFVATGAAVTAGALSDPGIKATIDALRAGDIFCFFGPPALYRAHDARKALPTLALGHCQHGARVVQSIDPIETLRAEVICEQASPTTHVQHPHVPAWLIHCSKLRDLLG